MYCGMLGLFLRFEHFTLNFMGKIICKMTSYSYVVILLIHVSVQNHLTCSF